MKTKEAEKPKKHRARMRHYTEALKLQVCREHMEGIKTQKQILDEYDVKFMGAIQYWMRELNLDQSPGKPVLRGMRKKAQSPVPQAKVNAEEKNLSSESELVKELRRKLEDSELRAEGYLRMIELAEQELNISIRKKASTK